MIKSMGSKIPTFLIAAKWLVLLDTVTLIDKQIATPQVLSFIANHANITSLITEEADTVAMVQLCMNLLLNALGQTDRGHYHLGGALSCMYYPGKQLTQPMIHSSQSCDLQGQLIKQGLDWDWTGTRLGLDWRVHTTT